MVDEKDVSKGGFHTKWSPSKKNDLFLMEKFAVQSSKHRNQLFQNPKEFLISSHLQDCI